MKRTLVPVTPDELQALEELRQQTLGARYVDIINSWPFEGRDNNQQQQQEQQS